MIQQVWEGDAEGKGLGDEAGEPQPPGRGGRSRRVWGVRDRCESRCCRPRPLPWTAAIVFWAAIKCGLFFLFTKLRVIIHGLLWFGESRHSEN